MVSAAVSSFSRTGHKQVLLNDWLFAKGSLDTEGRMRDHEPMQDIQITEREPLNAEAYYVMGT